MKIGILTFHRAHNYGAVLQAYALVGYLRDNGHEAEIIDYRQKSIEQAHGTFPYGRIKKMSFLRRVIYIIKIIPYLAQRRKRAERFRKFISSLPKSERVFYDTDKAIDGYDYIIVGSDQVWNPKITDGFDPFYTGEISTTAKFISYAASAEITPKQEGIAQYKGFLHNFARLSVRESLFRDQLQSSTSIDIEQVLDPVFLLDKEKWNSFGINTFNEKDYILVYQVKRDDNVLRYAHELAEYNQCSVKEITAEADIAPLRDRYTTLSPAEFVGAFANAKCVVTTSFHGTAFSCIFRKPFKVMLFNKPGDYRAVDLLNTLGLTNATIYPSSCGKEKISSFNAPANMDKMIKQSKCYLNFHEYDKL